MSFAFKELTTLKNLFNRTLKYYRRRAAMETEIELNIQPVRGRTSSAKRQKDIIDGPFITNRRYALLPVFKWETFPRIRIFISLLPILRARKTAERNR